MAEVHADHSSLDEPKSILNVPEEILEHILMKVSPYKDLKSASLVCTTWYRLVKGIMHQ